MVTFTAVSLPDRYLNDLYLRYFSLGYSSTQHSLHSDRRWRRWRGGTTAYKDTQMFVPPSSSSRSPSRARSDGDDIDGDIAHVNNRLRGDGTRGRLFRQNAFGPLRRRVDTETELMNDDVLHHDIKRMNMA